MRPIILAHGIARFDALFHPLVRLLPDRWQRRLDCLHYFRNIATHLRANGFTVYHSDVQFAETVAIRAERLRENVRAVAQQAGSAVHVIGHSMGGLDARYAIAELATVEIAVLSTIGTPHLGTSFADWGMRRAHGDAVIEALRPVVSIDGLSDLTPKACAHFNSRVESIEAANRVQYFAYGASQSLSGVFSLLRSPWQIIRQSEGDNDGLVSLRSQLWKPQLTAASGAVKTVRQHRIEVPLDHFNECGWWDRRETEPRRQFESKVKDVYLAIARAGNADLVL